MEFLWETARKSLEANRVQTPDGALTVAGGHQFKTLWVRDFCFSVPGLMAIGAQDSARAQLEVCYRHQRSDGLIARGFDVTNPKARVVARSFHLPFAPTYAGRALKPEYLGEHGTPAIDSNLLVLLASLQWMERQGSTYFLDRYSLQMERAFQFILNSRDGELFNQPAFSDWQDSARREGKTFYMNLLFVRVLARLQALKVGWSMREDLELWKRALWHAFYDAGCGLFRSETGRGQFSLETQLWCIEEDIFKTSLARETLWKSLTRSDLWNPLPGRPVAPEYSPRDISWTTKLVGLRHYHDRFYWSWLMGESLKIAFLMRSQEDVTRITGELEKLARIHGTIHEIYEMKGIDLRPVVRPLYQSEFPFSWGAAKILEALSYRVAPAP